MWKYTQVRWWIWYWKNKTIHLTASILSMKCETRSSAEREVEGGLEILEERRCETIIEQSRNENLPGKCSIRQC